MSLSKAERARVYAIFDGRCAYCGCELPARWHADHVEPVIRYPEGGFTGGKMLSLHPERMGERAGQKLELFQKWHAEQLAAFTTKGMDHG